MRKFGQLWQPRENDFGVALATVIDTNDVDGLGRIKVAFELKRDGEGNRIQSDWLQIMSPFAGAGYGMFFLPERGASALVAFSGSDPSRAYVIGFLWNGKLKPPVDEADPQDVRVIQTKNGEKSKKIIMSDSDDGKIEIIDENKNVLRIDSANNKIEIVCGGSVLITSTGDGGIDIDSRGKVLISAVGQLRIVAESISLEAESNLTMKAPEISQN
jgi:uncharacterized protein involved in type VI secretion and phage assembly